MKLHLVDGTYELFRQHFGAPPRQALDGRQVGATLGLLRSLLNLVTTPGVTHVACAFDHVIESFRNDLYPGYKTSAGIDPDLLAQFPLAEDAVRALGIVVWPMEAFEADDALASAVKRYGRSKSVEQIVLCSPDKDLAELVVGKRVVCWDRRRAIVLDEAGVKAKFGVPPASIPDFLALVGDSADGYPGLPGWGEKSTAAVLRRFPHLEDIPADSAKWKVKELSDGRAARLAQTLVERREDAVLFRTLATLRRDVPLIERQADLKWRGATPALRSLCQTLGDERFPARITTWRE